MSGPLQGPQDSALQNVQPDKVGWIRKFCGKGIFRDIWKNRFVVLRGDQLFINEKEVSPRGRGLLPGSFAYCHGNQVPSQF